MSKLKQKNVIIFDTPNPISRKTKNNILVVRNNMQFFRRNLLNCFHLFTGLVPEPQSEVQKEGKHQEGARTSGPQCAPTDVLRGADISRGAREKGARPQGEEDGEAAREAAEEARGEGHPRGR